MPVNIWNDSLKQAEEELVGARQELEKAKSKAIDLEERVKALEETVQAISRLCTTQTVDADPGLRDACMAVFTESLVPLSIPELRDLLVKNGFKMNYRNPLAVLHTTVKRLEKSEFVDKKEVGGQTKYEAAVPF